MPQGEHEGCCTKRNTLGLWTAACILAFIAVLGVSASTVWASSSLKKAKADIQETEDFIAAGSEGQCTYHDPATLEGMSCDFKGSYRERSSSSKTSKKVPSKLTCRCPASLIAVAPGLPDKTFSLVKEIVKAGLPDRDDQKNMTAEQVRNAWGVDPNSFCNPTQCAKFPGQCAGGSGCCSLNLDGFPDTAAFGFSEEQCDPDCAATEGQPFVCVTDGINVKAGSKDDLQGWWELSVEAWHHNTIGFAVAIPASLLLLILAYFKRAKAVRSQREEVEVQQGVKSQREEVEAQQEALNQPLTTPAEDAENASPITRY